MLKLKTITDINKEIGFLTGKNVSNKKLNSFNKGIDNLIKSLENSQNKREESIKRDIDTILKSIDYNTNIAEGDIDLTI